MKNYLFRFLTVLTLTGFLFACSAKESAKTAQPNPADTARETENTRTVAPNPKEILNADGVIETHAISLRSEPKYPPGFTHFDYVNPDAPKGGSIVYASISSYDNFNRYALRGVSAPNSRNFYDKLTVSSMDEVEVYYGLIAEKMIYPPDYTWIIFQINPRATFQDGKPIKAEDVKFTFNKFWTEGVPQFKEYYKNVISVDILDEYRIKFSLDISDKEMLISLCKLIVIPSQYWADRNWGEPLLEPPLGSGPYTVSEYTMGEYVVYKRLDDYWAKDHPTQKGIHNLDFVRFDIYRDNTVQLEALKSGDIDIKVENEAKQWATQYKGPNFDAGYIVKSEIPNELPPGIAYFYLNTELDQLANRSVRQALALMLDFEWMNRNLFYNQYKRLRSYFQNTPFEAMGLPSEEEIAILEPIREQIPSEVFTEEYQPSKTDGSGNIRRQMAEAIELLKQAGWELQDQTMTNVETGEPLTLELLIYRPSEERIAIPYQENLKKIGIELKLRMIDTAQINSRLRKRDYDIINGSQYGAFFPDSSLRFKWHSAFIDSTYNGSGVQDPAIDYLIDGIIAAQNNNTELLYWGRALDRVLQWQQFTIFRWYISYYRIAWWDKYSRPAIKPKYDSGIGTWWYDPEKASRLPGQ